MYVVVNRNFNENCRCCMLLKFLFVICGIIAISYEFILLLCLVLIHNRLTVLCNVC